MDKNRKVIDPSRSPEQETIQLENEEVGHSADNNIEPSFAPKGIMDILKVDNYLGFGS